MDLQKDNNEEEKIYQCVNDVGRPKFSYHVGGNVNSFNLFGSQFVICTKTNAGPPRKFTSKNTLQTT